MHWTATGPPTQFSLALEAPHPAHCSSRPQDAHRKSQAGLDLTSGFGMSKTPWRSRAGRAGNQEKPRTSAPGRSQRPNPAPGAKFPKTDTLPGRARGGAHGLPRRVPWRPRPRRPPLLGPQDRRAKGRPKTPAHGACRVFPPDGTLPGRSVDAGTPTPSHTAPHSGAGGRGAHPAPRIHRVTQRTTL